MRGDQTVWTCDGCKKRAAESLGDAPRGWFTVEAQDAAGGGFKKSYHLCLSCFAGVDWILRFQGVTVPPKVVSEPRQIERMVSA